MRVRCHNGCYIFFVILISAKCENSAHSENQIMFKIKQYSDFKNCLAVSYTFILYSDAYTHTHTQLNKVIQHQFNHYTHKQKHLGIQSGKHGLILPCFSEKKCKRLKPGKKIHESRILADYLWVLLLLVIIFCISTQRGRKSATGAASIPSDLE